MNELKIASMDPPSDLRVLSEDKLDDVNGGLAFLFGVAAIGFFVGAYFNTMTIKLIKAL